MTCYRAESSDGILCEECNEVFYIGICLTCTDKLKQDKQDLLTALKEVRDLTLPEDWHHHGDIEDTHNITCYAIKKAEEHLTNQT